MKKYLLLATVIIATTATAQVPEDALRYSFYPQSGTARNMAIGGAMGSLGGDINAIFVNPAGLGMYRTGEFVFTPSYSLNNNKTDFRESITKSKKNNFGIGPIGLVLGGNDPYNKTNSYAFSIAFTQTANFNNYTYYKGYNNYSSYSEQWAEQFAKSGQTPGLALNNPAFAYGTAPALYTYLVDTFTIDGQTVIKATPEFAQSINNALLQENTVRTKGGIYELALGFASNKNDKLYIGGSLGIPIISYKNTTTFRETDTSSNTSNRFGYFNYTDDFSTTGAGLNAKLGVIYKPKEYIRLGLAIHTPSFMFALKDKRKTSLESQTEDYNGLASVSSETFTGSTYGESKYMMTTPWKVMISGSYVFRETEDVKRQRAFITADIEYVHHRGSSFYSAAEAPTVEDKAYYKLLNKVIRGEYKGNFNFRVGGELKFNTIMGRLGFAYYSNPYKDAALKTNRMLLSGGLGYRDKGFFIDLTYVHAFNKDVNFPYRLEDKDNTFATTKNQRGNIVATVGVKF